MNDHRKTEDNKSTMIAPIEDISEETKEKCLNWLQDICLLKKGIKGLNEKLPRVCRNGLIFIDIVNRIHGRTNEILGINRTPKIPSHLRANYQKLFTSLR